LEVGLIGFVVACEIECPTMEVVDIENRLHSCRCAIVFVGRGRTLRLVGSRLLWRHRGGKIDEVGVAREADGS